MCIEIHVVACAGAGGGSGGVPFEVWCRFYYPNVRDQVIAKVFKLYPNYFVQLLTNMYNFGTFKLYECNFLFNSLFYRWLNCVRW